MDWTKLKTGECPHCYHVLEDRKGEMRCTACKFHIEYRRYHQIKAVRNKDRSDKPMKWQMLKEGKCPMCNSFLKEITGKQGYMRCVDFDCPFRIDDERIQGMLGDPSHPINKYGNDIQS